MPHAATLPARATQARRSDREPHRAADVYRRPDYASFDSRIGGDRAPSGHAPPAAERKLNGSTWLPQVLRTSEPVDCLRSSQAKRAVVVGGRLRL